jgi:hypothetical protein
MLLPSVSCDHKYTIVNVEIKAIMVCCYTDSPNLLQNVLLALLVATEASSSNNLFNVLETRSSGSMHV